MKKLLILGLFLSVTSFANAMPGMSSKDDAGKMVKSAEDKFTNMDSNKDAAVSSEEFTKAYPQMNEAVFGIIDADKNKTINLKEWMDFQANHMKGMQEEKKPASGSQMLIMPPKSE